MSFKNEFILQKKKYEKNSKFLLKNFLQKKKKRQIINYFLFDNSLN